MRRSTESDIFIYICIYIYLSRYLCALSVWGGCLLRTPFPLSAMHVGFVPAKGEVFFQSRTNHQDCSSALTLLVINKSSEEQRVTSPL